MYNRYTPQPDGSHRRRSIPDPPAQPQAVPVQPPQPTRPEPVQEPSAPKHTPMGVGNFLRQLLPKNFDTGDLIVVLLLLLIAADSQEDQNSALLTLALYLFL